MPSTTSAMPMSEATTSATIPMVRAPALPAASSATRSAATGTRIAMTSAHGAHVASASAPAPASTAATADTDAARAGSGGRNATTHAPSAAKAQRPRTDTESGPSLHHQESAPDSSREVGSASMMVASASAHSTAGRTSALPSARRDEISGSSSGPESGRSAPKAPGSGSMPTAATPAATTDPSTLNTARISVAGIHDFPSTLSACMRVSAPRRASVRRRSASNGPVRRPAKRTNHGPVAERPPSSCCGAPRPAAASPPSPSKSSNPGSPLMACLRAWW